MLFNLFYLQFFVVPYTTALCAYENTGLEIPTVTLSGTAKTTTIQCYIYDNNNNVYFMCCVSEEHNIAFS